MVFQMTPGTEAPAEMNTYFPQFRAMWMAENTTNTLHNVLTLRGAQVRDPLKWASYLNETIDLYGAERGREVPGPPLAAVGQRQDHRLLEEAARPLQVHSRPVGEPDEQGLHRHRDLQHGQAAAGTRQAMVQSRLLRLGQAQHARRLSALHGLLRRHPGDARPVAAGRRRQEVRRVHGRRAGRFSPKAKADFDKGEYRWVAEILKHVVFADPNNKDAKDLLADAYEQMGYQAESGPWRSVYLQGAYELRNGVPSAGGTNIASPDTIKAMPPEMTFDYFGVRLNGEKAAGKKLALNIDFTDLNKSYALVVENGVLNYFKKPVANADAKLTLSKSTLDRIQLGETAGRAGGDVRRDEGRRQARSVHRIRRHCSTTSRSGSTS